MMTQNCSLSAGELALQQGMTAARAGFKSLATAQLERAAELLPDNPAAWLWLAWLASSPDNSRHCLQRVLELKPGHPAATAGLIWINSLTATEPMLTRVDTVDVPTVCVNSIIAAESNVDVPATVITEQAGENNHVYDEVGSTPIVVPVSSEPVKSFDKDGWEISIPAEESVTPTSVSTLTSIHQTEEASSNTEESRRRRWTDLVSRAAEMPLPPRRESGVMAETPIGLASETVVAVVSTPTVEPAKTKAVVQSRFKDVPIGGGSDEPASPPDNVKPRTVGLDRTKEAEPEISTDIETLTQSFNPTGDVVAADGRPLVMIVDDSPTVRKLVSLTLERRGYRVVSAYDGVAAIKELGACRPDLILLDINMPRLDGYRLCKLIKKHEATQSIPVVMLSGKDGMFDKLRGRLVGCSDYITKPFEADALTHKVAKYLTPAAASSL